MKQALLFVLLLITINANAQWFQATASAPIINNDIEQAREQAIKKAVKNALLFSGGSITSLQQVNQGVLVSNQLKLNASGEIKALDIISEEEDEQQLSVVINVDIVSPKQRCLGSQFPKSVSIARFALKVPEQTVDGEIYLIHKKVSETLHKQLSLNPSLLNVRSYIDKPMKLGEQYNNRQLVNTLSSISAQSDSQFIIFGEINDLSVNFDSKNSLSYWLTNPDRHFYMTIYLYDAFQGHLVFSKQYRQKPTWGYNKEEKADLNSKRFWELDYGQAILESLDQVNSDIAQQLQCTIPSARIVAINANKVQINLGRKNGLQQGTLVSIAYASNFKDQFGIERQSSNKVQQTMKVIEVYENSAELMTLDNYPLSNIQINDIARINSTQ